MDPFRHAIVTLTEKSTNFLLMAKLPEGRKALPTAKTVIRLLYPYKYTVKTITTKKANFNDFSDRKILEFQKKLNRRPRENLNFDTPRLRFFANFN